MMLWSLGPPLKPLVAFYRFQLFELYTWDKLWPKQRSGPCIGLNTKSQTTATKRTQNSFPRNQMTFEYTLTASTVNICPTKHLGILKVKGPGEPLQVTTTLIQVQKTCYKKSVVIQEPRSLGRPFPVAACQTLCSLIIKLGFDEHCCLLCCHEVLSWLHQPLNIRISRNTNLVLQMFQIGAYLELAKPMQNQPRYTTSWFTGRLHTAQGHRETKHHWKKELNLKLHINIF